MAANGNTLLVYLGSSAIAGTKSNEIQCGCETIEVSSPTQGQWRSFIVGRKEWSVNVSYLVAAATDVGNNILRVGQTYTLRMYNRTGTLILLGQAICTTCKITATRGNLITGSFVFKGNGALG